MDNSKAFKLRHIIAVQHQRSKMYLFLDDIIICRLCFQALDLLFLLLRFSYVRNLLLGQPAQKQEDGKDTVKGSHTVLFHQT